MKGKSLFAQRMQKVPQNADLESPTGFPNTFKIDQDKINNLQPEKNISDNLANNAKSKQDTYTINEKNIDMNTHSNTYA